MVERSLRKFNLKITIANGKPVVDPNSTKKALAMFDDELRSVSGLLSRKNASRSLNKSSTTVLKSMREISKAMQADFRGHLSKNPSHWERLGSVGLDSRRYYFFPELLANDIINASVWNTYNAKDGKKQSTLTPLFSEKAHNTLMRNKIKSEHEGTGTRYAIDQELKYRYQFAEEKSIDEVKEYIINFCSGLRGLSSQRAPGSTMSGPALLLTGRLMEGIKTKVQKSTDVNPTTGVNIFNYGIYVDKAFSVPYAYPHFYGGTIYSTWLIITRESTRTNKEFNAFGLQDNTDLGYNNAAPRTFVFKFPIPWAYANAFRSFKLSYPYTVKLERTSSPVHARDPFYFDEQSIKAMDKFENKIGVELDKTLYRQMEKELAQVKRTTTV